ncbi:MAG: hypothetical protein OHK93_006262 [Ramalina farinacea]|uniref:RING-type domain-containing protein n=1 Tax=Ramalina farinacea TaxID=258253 RepID=A0AA43QI80_9LECA|nr:hypothetical protein [Ramalina farinacea]
MSTAVAVQGLKAALIVRDNHDHTTIQAKEPNFLHALEAWDRLCVFEDLAGLQGDEHVNSNDRELLMIREWEYPLHKPQPPPALAYLESLPRIAWATVPEDKDECGICQSKYSDTVTPRRLVCKHLFCSHCIQQWLSPAQAARNSCPACRKVQFSEIPPPDSLETLEVVCDMQDYMVDAGEVPANSTSVLCNKTDLLTCYVEMAAFALNGEVKHMKDKGCNKPMASLSIKKKLKYQELFLRQAMIYFLKMECAKRKPLGGEDFVQRLARNQSEMGRLAKLMESLTAAWRYQGAIESCLEQHDLDDLMLQAFNNILKDSDHGEDSA